jgi:D-arabinose 1-dehydrogenase-like Zn-dependent alcohol dehydrogenase
MKAAVLTQVGEPLQIRDRPDPEPGPNNAIIRVEACGICRSDWHIWRGDWTWAGVNLPLPFVLGHEFGGTVEATGPGVQGFHPGDRVTIPFNHGCGHCANCYTGRSNICLGGGANFGGFAELAEVKDADVNLVHRPAEVDAIAAAGLGCRFMTAYHGLVDRARIRAGEWVAVYGAGGVGLSAVQIASALGARVVAVDINEEKLGRAEAEGALATVNATEGPPSPAVKEMTGGGADVTVDALGSSATAIPAVLSLKKGGRHLQIGLTSSDDRGQIALPVDAMILQEQELITSYGCPVTSYPGLLALVASGRFDPKRLVTRTVPLAATNDVLRAMSDYGTIGLTVITSW